MTICTVRSGGTVDTAAAVVTLDDDLVPDPQPANSGPSATAAASHAAMFRMMRRDAACNWPRVPNDSVQTLTETPTLIGAVQSPACRANGTSGSSWVRKDVEDPGAGRRDADDIRERAADRAVGAARVDTPGKKAVSTSPAYAHSRGIEPEHCQQDQPASPVTPPGRRLRLPAAATDQDF